MTTSNSTVDLLNLNQSPQELAGLYGPKDYYWYLRSQTFIETFIKPIAEIVNRLGHYCIDAGCGEGCLADWVMVPYVGFDGSEMAIRRARNRNRLSAFLTGRLEDPPIRCDRPSTVVFGGIMEVLIKPEARVPLMEMYRERFSVNHFIIYDLERLDTTSIQERYGPPIEEIHASAEPLPNLDHEVKRHRKILVYKTQP